MEKKLTNKQRGKYVRQRGHRLEREIINELKGIGFIRAISSRQESRSQDAKKIDICYTDPFNFSCKSKDKGSFAKYINEIEKGNNYNVLIYKVNNGIDKGIYALLTWNDLKEIIIMLKKE